jgi:hypothetical protein
MAIGRNRAQISMRLSIVFLLLVLQSAHPLAASEKENSSNPSVSWSTGGEMDDLREGSDLMESLEENGDEFTGGFSTLDSMLQWAIGTSTRNSRNFSTSQFSFSFFLGNLCSLVLLFVEISLVIEFKLWEH